MKIYKYRTSISAEPESVEELRNIFGRKVSDNLYFAQQIVQNNFLWMCDQFSIKNPPKIHTWVYIRQSFEEAGFFTSSKDEQFFYVMIPAMHLELFMQDVEQKIIPHEVTHAFHRIYDKITNESRPHGKEFVELMEYFFSFYNLSYHCPDPISRDSLHREFLTRLPQETVQLLASN